MINILLKEKITLLGRSFRSAWKAFVPLFVVFTPCLLLAQSWRSSLFPENWQPPGAESPFYSAKLIQDFSYAGYHRGEVPVPEIAGPIFNVVMGYGADPTAASDSTAAIQAAIDAAEAAGGGVVYLPEGEYKLALPGSQDEILRIDQDNVVLRGAGADKTFLLNTTTNMRNKAVIRLTAGSTPTSSWVSISEDLPAATKRIPLADASGFSVGDYVELEWTFTTDWIAEHGQSSYWNSSSKPTGPRYRREVTAVNSGEGWIEIDVPTRYYMLMRDNARVRKISGFVSESAVEDLAIGNYQSTKSGYGENQYNTSGTAAYDSHASYIIDFSNTRDCWIKRVNTYRPSQNSGNYHILSNGIKVERSFRITVEGCDLARAQYLGGGGNGYLYRIQDTQECLITTCDGSYGRHNFVLSHASTSGNVFHRCNDVHCRDSDNHMHFSHSNLWDQCTSHDSTWSAAHRASWGTVAHALTAGQSVYWNTVGTGGGGTGGHGSALVVSEQGRYGYVIGTSGTRTGVSSGTSGNTSPADHVEGVGMGDMLEPASLYLDQLQRRTGLWLGMQAESTAFPNNTIHPVVSLSYGGINLLDPESVQWAVTSSPSGAVISTEGTGGLSPSFSVDRPGTYTIELGVEHNGENLSKSIEVSVGTPDQTNYLDIIAEADSYVHDGSYSNVNHGTESILAMKNVNSSGYNRKALLRFDVSSLTGMDVDRVELHEWFTSDDPQATMKTSVMSDDSWGETTVTYSNMPSTVTEVLGNVPLVAQDWLVQDVSSQVSAQVDGKITFLHEIVSQTNSGPLFYIASRENDDETIRPRLRVFLTSMTAVQWAEDHGVSGDLSDPDQDPDGDGLDNLMEAWLGTSPSEKNQRAVVTGSQVEGELQLDLMINESDLEGVYYYVEQSGDLLAESWLPAPGVVWEVQSPQSGRRAVKARISLNGSEDKCFYRVKVIAGD